MRKKAQAWGIDLFIAITIFLVAIVSFYFYSSGYSSSQGEYAELKNEANVLSDSLLSEGFPIDWNSGNVATIGLLSGDNLNLTKAEKFYNFSKEDYEKTKKIFAITNDYYLNFSRPMRFGGQDISEFGLKPASQKNIARVSRITSLEDRPVLIEVQVWN